jgi:hypothetical protein
MKTTLLLLNAVFVILILIHSVNRDIKLESHYTSDLRNRVVGARLEKDGKLPYNYLWNTNDGERYYDLANRHAPSGSSNITASPFFHQLMFPLCDLPQRTISKIWICLQYFFLIIMLVLTCRIAANIQIICLIVNTGVLFTLTEAWKILISAGQLYFFEAMLMNLILYFFLKKNKCNFVTAGILSIVLVLTRPISIVLFIPFLFNYKKYVIFLNSAASALLVYGFFVLASSYQKNLYRNYLDNMKLQILFHQGLIVDSLNGIITTNRFPFLEGVDFKKALSLEKQDNIPVYSESGNFFVLWEKLFHSKIPVYVLNFVSCMVVILLSFLFFRKTPDGAYDLKIMLLGLTLYMIAEMFNPVHRHQYNTVQWFPIVLAGLLLYKNRITMGFILLLAGLLLNISNTQLIPMRHTFGEICWIAALLILVFSPVEKLTIWKLQS